MKTKILLLTIVLLLGIMNIEAQSLSSKDVVDISANVSVEKKIILEIRLDIRDGWHINSNKPFDEFLTPTSVSLKDSSAFSEIKTEYPAPEIIRLEFSQTDLSLYQNQAVIKMILKPKDSEIKEINIEGSVFYQPCNNQTCLFPTKKQFSAVYKSK